MKRFQSIDDCLDYIETHPEEFVLWLESDLVTADLKTLAARNSAPKVPKAKLWKRLTKWVTPGFRGWYGSAYVDDTLKQDAASTAKLCAATNGINIIPTLPIIGYGFSGLGVLGYGLATGFTGLLFGLTTWAAQQAVTERSREKRGGALSVLGVLALQLIPSLLSGPGSVLLLDKASLAQNWAEVTVEQTIESNRELQLQQLTVKQQQAEQKAQECSDLEDEMLLYPEGSAIANRLYLRAKGKYADANIDRSAIPLESLDGVCWVAQRLEGSVTEEQEHIETIYTQAKQKVAERGAMQSMQEDYPALYALHFKSDGSLLSGRQAAMLATQLFIRELRQGHIGALLIPMLFFSLSTTTSLLMVIKLRRYRNRPDVLRSFDASIALFRDEVFHRAQLGLLKQEQQIEQYPLIDNTDHLLP